MYNEKQVGKIAANGQFYTPKYWVAKIKTDSDVLIKTAEKCLYTCQEVTEKLYPTKVEKEEIIYVSIEIKNIPDI